MNKKWPLLALLVLGTLGLVALRPWVGLTGEFHTSGTLICFDCHTIHYSESQGNSATDPYGTGTPIQYPLTAGPHPYLLRQPQNSICLSCHDGKTNAPDVYGANINASPEEGRGAGTLPTGAAPFQSWKGHTLGVTDTPPGYNPSLVGLGDWYTGTSVGLKCIHCHEFHGTASPYRNLGLNALGPTVANFQPSYVVSLTNDVTKDVWINIDPATYTPSSGNPAVFNPYYSGKKIQYNRIDATVGSLKTSNKMGSFCATCHANFHGGPGDIGVGASPGALDGFLRHPTAQVTIGAASGQGYGGHSSLSRFVGKTNKVKVFTTDYTAYSNATPGCVSCHKAHGNQNPFGLIFMAGTGTIGEEGTGTDPIVGMRDLCGQCHGQGN